MKKILLLLLTSTTLLGTSVGALGAPIQSSGQSRLKKVVKKEQAKPKVEETPSAFSLGVIYSLGQDLAEQTTPKKYKNYLTGNLGYSITNKLTIGAELGLSYVTLDGRPQEQTTGNYGTFDFNYDVGASYKTTIFTDNSLRFSGGVSIPTDEESRFEGIQALPYLSTGINTPLYSTIWTMDNSASYNYTLNRYETSVTGDSNPESSLSYALGTKFKFKNGFSFGFGAAVKITRYLDDFIAYSYNNTQTIAYSYGSFSTSLSHINGGFVEKGELDLWYVDKYRRYITWRVSYAF